MKKNDIIGHDASKIMRDGRYSKANKSEAGKALASLRSRKR